MKWCGNEERVSNNDRNDFKPMLMRTKMMLTVILMPVLPSSICAWSVIKSPRRAVVALQFFLIVVVVPQFWKKKTGFTHSVVIGSIFFKEKYLPYQCKSRLTEARALPVSIRRKKKIEEVVDKCKLIVLILVIEWFLTDYKGHVEYISMFSLCIVRIFTLMILSYKMILGHCLPQQLVHEKNEKWWKQLYSPEVCFSLMLMQLICLPEFEFVLFGSSR